MEILPVRVKELRNGKHLSQEELASLVGVSMHTVFRWEKGERVPDANELTKLAKALDTTVAYLLGETDRPSISEIDASRKRSDSAKMFDRLMEQMAKHSPDLVLHFRDLDENIDELEPEDLQALADGFAILTGMTTKGIEKRMRRKSRHGEL